jgi:prepilin-type N-terminal cleavage/methylation domain-containing protein
MNQETGYTLIEIIASLVIVGIIATFSSLFLVVGIQGYEFTRKAADAAMKTEVALNRISLELRAINTIRTPAPGSTSINYTCSSDTLTGDRALKFVTDSIYITAGGTDYKVLDDVSAFTLSYEYDELDYDTDTVADEVKYIDVNFTISDIPAFSTRIYPRAMITKDW